ncbi:cupin domain-containing protein [Corallococcus llansteffanensis]|uniref:Cupin domain-containing protein n=2 Tax=Corallococcus llansteffanensis TaxID=2316731 RepID=A0A3A8PNL5_9BACT|nr:cupin domain-containing protein [Corallococcus llansteffanensis]
MGGTTLAHAASPGARAASQHLMVRPDDVRWGPPAAALPPGAQMAVIEGDPAAAGKLFTFRFRFPAGYRIPPHFHPADEHVTVLSGELLMGMGEKFDASKAQALPPGSFAVMPATLRHFAFTRQPTEVQIHAVGPWGITYVNPEDDPRNTATGGAGMQKQP